MDPQRLVVMTDSILANLLHLGFPPDRIVGFAREGLRTEDYAYFTDITAFRDVGGFPEPNLEAVTAARPDLIVVPGEQSGLNVEFFRELRNRLATTGTPVFAVLNGYQSVDAHMGFLADVGRAVGREEAAAEAERGFRDRLPAVRERLAADGLPTAKVVRVLPDVMHSVHQPLLEALGVPGERPSIEEYGVEVSTERLDLLDADVLFVSYADSEPAARGALEANPLWPELTAVREGRVFFVPQPRWADAWSIPALDAQLDDIETALTPTG